MAPRQSPVSRKHHRWNTKPDCWRWRQANGLAPAAHDPHLVVERHATGARRGSRVPRSRARPIHAVGRTPYVIERRLTGIVPAAHDPHLVVDRRLHRRSRGRGIRRWRLLVSTIRYPSTDPALVLGPKDRQSTGSLPSRLFCSSLLFLVMRGKLFWKVLPQDHRLASAQHTLPTHPATCRHRCAMPKHHLRFCPLSQMAKGSLAATSAFAMRRPGDRQNRRASGQLLMARVQESRSAERCRTELVFSFRLDHAVLEVRRTNQSPPTRNPCC